MLFERSSAIAIVDPERGETLTFNDVVRGIDELMPIVSSKTRGLIFLLSDNSVGSILAYLAALQSNNAVALINARLVPERIAGLVDSYKPDVIIDCVGSSHFEGQTYVREQHKSRVCALRAQRDAAPISGNLTKLLLPTSGSTGGGKMVRLSNENLEANALSIAEALAIKSGDRAVLSLPIHYSYGLSVLNSHLASGATVVVTRHMLTSKLFWNHLRETEVTSFAGVPYSYEILKRLDIDALGVPQLKTMTQAGGKLSNESIGHFHQIMSNRGGRFFTMYGQTEATARIAVLEPDRLPAKLGSVGKAIPGGIVEIRKVDRKDGGQAGDAAGEVVYRGRNVMLGYAAGREDLDLGDINQGVLYTGDLGFLDGDGMLYITGRTQRFGKIFGIRLNLDEIEALLSREGSLAVVSDDQRLLIYCEGDTYARVQPRKVQLAQSLGIHHSAICPIAIESLPRKSNGKIDYMKLITDACDT